MSSDQCSVDGTRYVVHGRPDNLDALLIHGFILTVPCVTLPRLSDLAGSTRRPARTASNSNTAPLPHRSRALHSPGPARSGSAPGPTSSALDFAPHCSAYLGINGNGQCVFQKGTPHTEQPIGVPAGYRLVSAAPLVMVARYQSCPLLLVVLLEPARPACRGSMHK